MSTRGLPWWLSLCTSNAGDPVWTLVWELDSIIVIIQSLSHVWLFVTPWLQHVRFLCPPLAPRICSNSCPLSWWCYLTISSSVPFSSCPQSFPASVSSPKRQLLSSGGQNIAASATVLPMNIQRWFPLGFTSLISLQSKELSSYSRVLQLKIPHATGKTLCALRPSSTI